VSARKQQASSTRRVCDDVWARGAHRRVRPSLNDDICGRSNVLSMCLEKHPYACEVLLIHAGRPDRFAAIGAHNEEEGCAHSEGDRHFSGGLRNHTDEQMSSKLMCTYIQCCTPRSRKMVILSRLTRNSRGRPLTHRLRRERATRGVDLAPRRTHIAHPAASHIVVLILHITVFQSSAYSCNMHCAHSDATPRECRPSVRRILASHT
jgi:hypothetical protein